MHQFLAPAEMEAALAAVGDGVPDAEAYQRLTTLVLDHPTARALNELDPFSPAYRERALALYLELRRGQVSDYIAARDEAPASGVPAAIWTGLIPWAFRDATLLAEFLVAWAQILRLLALRPGDDVLEYGPGSGQILLMLARMGYGAYGVDIDEAALEGIRQQATGLGVPVPVERAEFGEGFGDRQFDRIVFFEAFHHAFNFDALLVRLQARLKPGGHVVLCGEPIVPEAALGIPYPWGPRLDALSLFCIRRFGWMELGFTHAFLVEAARRTGWTATFHDAPGCGRAQAYVLRPGTGDGPAPAASPAPPASPAVDLELLQAREALAAVHRSTSWRVTAPLRAIARRLH